MRRWRRRLLALVSLHLSPSLRTHPGCFKTKFLPPGSGCRCLRPSTRLLLHPGCGLDGAPPLPHLLSDTCCQNVPACSSIGCLSRTSRPYRKLPRTVARRPCTCSTYCSCFSRLWNALSCPPALSRSFFGCHPPFVQPTGNPVPPSAPGLALWLPRWHNQMLWTFHRALPRTWSRAGRRTSCARSNLAGHTSLVTLHLSRPLVPLFLLRTWAPTRCGSWVPLTTERRYGLSVRLDQNEQTVASVKAVVLVSDLLLTDIGTGSGTAECLLTPPPRPDACLLPPNAHGWAVITLPVGSAPLKVVSDLRGLACLGDHSHLATSPWPFTLIIISSPQVPG